MSWLTRMLGWGRSEPSDEASSRRTGPRWYVPRHGDKDRFISADGEMPPLHLIPYGDGLALCEDSTGLLVSTTDRRLFAAGIYAYNLPGSQDHQETLKECDFSPGARVRLVRDDDHPDDPNAVGVTAAHEGAPIAAYLSRGHAARLAKLLDDGLVLDAVSLRGTGPGLECEVMRVCAAIPDVLEHLLSPRPDDLPPPVFTRAF